MHNGYIKIWRKFREHPKYHDSEFVHLWVHLLMLATHKEIKKMFNGKIITLKPGQLITSRRSLKNEIRISESKIDRLLKWLKTEHQIEQQTCNTSRLITILKWSHYQKTEPQNEPQMNHEWATSEPRVNTNKNVKNVKNVKKIKDLKTSVEFETFWKSYPRKQDKQNAIKAFSKITFNGELALDDIIKSLESQKLSDQWQKDKGQFIPLPATWLNGKRWEDEFSPDGHKKLPHQLTCNDEWLADARAKTERDKHKFEGLIDWDEK